MRSLKFISICLVLSSCIEEVNFQLDQYVKVLSLDRSSFAERIIELDNGDLMILGEMGTAAFEQESTGQGSEVTALEDQAPFIAITDPNGNLKMLRMYPFEGFLVDSPFGEIILENIENKTSFHEIIPTADGGYLVHAQSLGFDYIFNGQLFQSEPGATNYNDFLIKLNNQFDVEHIQSMQGQPGWDGIRRLRGKLKQLNNSEVGFLLSQRLPFTQNTSSGFTFLHLTDALDTIQVSDIQATTDFIGQDFTIDENNNFTLLATTQSDFEIFQSSISNVSLDSSTPIAGDGVLNGENRDENYIEILADGTFIIVYTQPITGIIMEHRDRDMSLISGPFDISDPDGYQPSTIRATRAVEITSDGDVLIYVLNIGGGVNERLSGELFKVSTDGVVAFRNGTEGVPGDVRELRDGSLVTVSNRVYNGSLQKIHITKMSANGKME